MGDEWDILGAKFVNHYASLRGRVRTHVIDRHLAQHLAPAPASVVDVGGGAGHQSLPLARRGYDVTLVDPSPAMLARAKRALGGQPAEVASRIALVEASAAEAPAALGGQRFTAVLCHGVIMYVEDPRALVSTLASLLEPGGIVSIVAKNAAALACRPAARGDWAEALRSFSTRRQLGGLGVDTRADTVGEIEGMLEEAGVTTLDWYGVRLFTDGWAPDRPRRDPEATVLAVELEASRRDPYRALSRLLHIVGRRPTEEPQGPASSCM
ncbi:MAG: class I SAM-dependent methyltransferase [Acidimicrobiales bacterium]